MGLVNLIIVTRLEKNMHKLKRINNVHHLITNYSHDELTTNSIAVLSNRLINNFTYIYIVKVIK